jgi:hypothetical protein
MDGRFIPKNRNERLAHVECEIGELTQAIGRMHRWGAHSRDPDLAPTEPTNAEHIVLEMWDLQYAINATMKDLAQFIGDARIRELQVMWATKAHVPQQDAEPPPEVVRSVCPTCEGRKMIEEKLPTGHTLRQACSTCSGRGFVEKPIDVEGAE